MAKISRREFGALAVGSVLVPKLVLGNPSNDSSGQNKKTLTADEWIKEWKDAAKRTKEIQGPLDLRRFKDPIYVLLNPISWKPNGAAKKLAPVNVPRGFVTDFASVPRPFWSLFRPDGNYAYAAVIHDYLYWQQDRSRQASDAIFRVAMDDLKITDLEAQLLFKAVEQFGESAWNENAKLKKAGECRILSELPSTSDVAWSEWKKRNKTCAN